MSQTPNQGGPPEGGDPRESPQGWQPPYEPDPQHPLGDSNPQSSTPGPQQPGWQQPPGGSNPQSPMPGPQQPGWQQPPGGAGPPYAGGWQPQGAQQYPGGQPPPYPPPGGPGTYGHPYGPPPPQRGRRNGLIIGVIVAVGVLLAGVLAVVGVNMLRGGNENEAASDPSASEAPSAQEPTEDGSARADVPASSCLPYEPVLASFGFDLSTGCDSPDAFWRVTNSSDTTGAAVTLDGTLADTQVARDLCGEEYARLNFGELWKDWYFTYDTTTYVVEQLVCVEALGNPDEAGRLPVMPDIGSCFDDSDRWWTVPCDRPEAQYVVVDTVAIEPPRTMSLDEAGAESAPCSGGANYWQVVDADGRTTDVLCGDPLLLA
jgi:hypothetical protein